MGNTLVLITSSATLVIYLNKHRGSTSMPICLPTQQVFIWVELHSLQLVTRAFPLRRNVMADQFSCLDQVMRESDPFILRYLTAFIDSRECQWLACSPHALHNKKLPVYISSVPNNITWNKKASQHSWD